MPNLNYPTRRLPLPMWYARLRRQQSYRRIAKMSGQKFASQYGKGVAMMITPGMMQWNGIIQGTPNGMEKAK